MWRIYDELIAAVPEDSVVSSVLVGQNWIAVRSEGVGLAMAQRESGGPRRHFGSPSGLKTRDVASWIKSWNFTEASIGLAAINSAVNLPWMVERRWGLRLQETASQDVFEHMKPLVGGKKVAVIGHFMGAERMGEICSLSILERQPRDGDYPDSACEYILGEQDVTIMTATTLINKTMPRLLELGRNSQIAVCGPSTPLVPVLFEHGVDLMGGLVVEDEAKAWSAVQEGMAHEVLSRGSRMINIGAPGRA